jgi:Tfp pilus assembly protein PilF
MTSRVGVQRAGVCLVVMSLLAAARPAQAADRWNEVKSAHFTVASNDSPGEAATVAWEFEQIRSAIGALWTWARVDLNKPLVVIAVKDENSMKALAPSYWEQKNGVRPATVWVEGVDQYYLAIRTDVKTEDNRTLNPYQQAYFSYVSLIVGQSLPRTLPLWFSRGFAGVVSNTVVRDQKILLGPPIPWHLRRLNSQARLPLERLIAVNRESPEHRTDEGLSTFDAEAWAFVHFMMFADQGARWPKLDRFLTLVGGGTEPGVAFREAIGSPDDLQQPFASYISRNLYSFRQFNVDLNVKRGDFPVRQLTADDIDARRALFLAAINRPIEARASIEQARKEGPAPDSWTAEALLLDREDKSDEAIAAYTRATDAGTANGYAYYRLASLMWRGDVDQATLTKVSALLDKAITLNPRHANAYAMAAEAHAALGAKNADGLAMRAISLDPSSAFVHYAAAIVLRRAGKYDDALQQASAAMQLAGGDAQMRERASNLAEAIRHAKGGGR